MNLDGLKREAERRLKRIERSVTLDLLGGNLDRVEKRRYARLASVDVARYLQPGETVELHRRLFPARDDRYYAVSTEQRRRLARLGTWTPCRVDTIGSCVRLLVPGHGSTPWPTGDFVRAVMAGHVRPPSPLP